MADGTVRDVTSIGYYDSSNPEIAEVDVDGHVTFKSRGEVAIIAHYLDLVANVRLTHLVEVPSFKLAEVPADNVIDKTVFAKLNRMRISPSEPCTDSEFVRRAYLDTIGVLPTPNEVEEFLADPSPNRRDQLVDWLLVRPEFYDFWTLKFADILRANGRLIQSKGTFGFNRWIRTHLEQNTPMDQFVRELLTADGSAFKNPPANYYRISRDPENLTETTAQLFLGSGSSAPSATTTSSRSGPRTITTASPRSSPASARRRGHSPRMRSSSALGWRSAAAEDRASHEAEGCSAAPCSMTRRCRTAGWPSPPGSPVPPIRSSPRAWSTGSGIT